MHLTTCTRIKQDKHTTVITVRVLALAGITFALFAVAACLTFAGRWAITLLIVIPPLSPLVVWLAVLLLAARRRRRRRHLDLRS